MFWFFPEEFETANDASPCGEFAAYEDERSKINVGVIDECEGYEQCKDDKEDKN